MQRTHLATQLRQLVTLLNSRPCTAENRAVAAAVVYTRRLDEEVEVTHRSLRSLRRALPPLLQLVVEALEIYRPCHSTVEAA